MTESEFEGPHDGYTIYLDWSALPTIRYAIRTPSDDSLASCVIEIDGAEVARHVGVPESFVEGTLNAGSAARTASVQIVDSSGAAMTWSYDVATEQVSYPPSP